jgi:hypothetical protein
MKPGEKRMQCAESLRVQAYFDGELDAPAAADIERHSENCAECRALLEDLKQVRTALREELTYRRAPPALRAQISRSLDKEGTGSRQRPSPFWKGAFSGIGGTALAAGIAFFLLAPPLTNPLLDDLVSAHVRSLMPDHLIDVVSTDKHTVKPWFAGHTDVSPVVADFDSQGYRLVGGLFRSSACGRGRLPAWLARHQCIQLGRAARRPAARYDPQWLSHGVLEVGKSGVLRRVGYRLGRASGAGALAAGSRRARQSSMTME